MYIQLTSSSQFSLTYVNGITYHNATWSALANASFVLEFFPIQFTTGTLEKLEKSRRRKSVIMYYGTNKFLAMTPIFLIVFSIALAISISLFAILVYNTRRYDREKKRRDYYRPLRGKDNKQYLNNYKRIKAVH